MLMCVFVCLCACMYIHVHSTCRCVYYTIGQHPGQAGEGRPRVLERRVLFGDTPQDVSSTLGAPSKVFFKAEDKVRVGCLHLAVPYTRHTCTVTSGF